MYPKLVALDTDWTLFWGWLSQRKWGKGKGAYSPVEDNIEQVNSWDIRDRTNHKNKCGLYADVPGIIHDILENGAQVAIVSRNTSKGLCDRALWYWKATDALGKVISIIDIVKFDEVYDRPKTDHFTRIKGLSNIDYCDMILFDDEATNNVVEMMLGVTFQVLRDQKGLTWENYRHGIDMWRRNKSIRSPFLGNNVALYPKKRLIGYSGMDYKTIELLEKGGRRQDRKEAARWGYAMYVADNPAIARYFTNWIKGNAFGNIPTYVCSIWARDGELFDNLQKIWVPDRRSMKTNVKSGAFRIAWRQEDRDRTVANWGVQKPYILFARHPYMGGMPIPRRRWNEMVVYGQIQEALILTVRMSEQEVSDAICANNSPRFEQMISAWNITVPQETWNDFRARGENITR